MKLVQRKRKQQYIKAYCLMYPWYIYEADCEFAEVVIGAGIGARNKPDRFKHGRHCLKWLLEYDAHSMSGETNIWGIVNDRW